MWREAEMIMHNILCPNKTFFPTCSGAERFSVYSSAFHGPNYFHGTKWRL
jgi:hypothetical protein